MTDLPRKVMTLCIVRQGSRVLLGMKKTGLGAGRWNGFGGKLEQGETIADSVVREVKEEADIDITDAREVGMCEFYSPVRPFIVEMHIFGASNFTGTPTESDEMRPQWFEVDALPKSEMWKSDLHWWPYFIKGKKFTGRFVFDKDDAVVDHDIREVE